MLENNIPHIVIIGAGFGGLSAANILKHNSNIHITLIDKNNYHVFQPFLYQVATSDLAPSDIAITIRNQFNKCPNVSVLMDEVIKINKQNKKIITKSGIELIYDYLIIATGSESNFFGNDDWQKNTVSLKNLNDALIIRSKLLESFEMAELVSNNRREELMTFVIIGGGATGVELAGSIKELIQQSLKGDFNNLNPINAKIILIEGSSRLLPSFNDKLSDIAKTSLENKGIIIKLSSKVKDIQKQKIILESGEEIKSNLIIWAAGVKASNVTTMFNDEITETGYNGRIKVKSDLSLRFNPEIFIIGDVCEVLDIDNKPLPGLAAVATQQGKFVAKVIKEKLKGNKKEFCFKYNNLGSLAIIGRYSAVAEFKNLKLYGIFAWLIWDIIHIYFLIGARNRIIVFIKWMWNYITNRRSERIIVKSFY
jgi:NADH dehydrogenase